MHVASSLTLPFPTLLQCFLLLLSAIGVQQRCWWWSRVGEGVEWQVVVGGDDVATDGCRELLDQSWKNGLKNFRMMISI